MPAHHREFLLKLLLVSLLLGGLPACRHLPGPVAVRPAARPLIPEKHDLALYNKSVARAARSAGWQLAQDFTQTGLKRYHRRSGAGVPVLEASWQAPRAFPGGSLSARTAVLISGELQILDAGRQDTVRIDGAEHPLAADFSLPWAMALDKAGYMAAERYRDVIRPKSPVLVFLMEPYDPARSILLLVHGWKDGPLMWRQLVNDLRADPDFRHRYQVWTVRYSTALPPLVAAAGLRRELRAALTEFDPQGRNPASRDIVVAAHSMGGLVSHALASDSGDRVWNEVVGMPRNALQGRAEDRATLTDWLIWKSLPGVRRVIFICVPHKGSIFAKNLESLGRRLERPRRDVQALVERTTAANPSLASHGGASRIPVVSVDDLAGGTPTMDALYDLPLSCPFHTIAGDFFPGEKTNRTDLVVRLDSALLPGARSQHIIRSGHKSYNAQKGLSAIAAILRDHAKAPAAPAHP